MHLRISHYGHVRIMSAKADPEFSFVRSWLSLRFPFDKNETYEALIERVGPIQDTGAFQKYVPEETKSTFAGILNDHTFTLPKAYLALSEGENLSSMGESYAYFKSLAMGESTDLESLKQLVFLRGKKLLGEDSFMNVVEVIRINHSYMNGTTSTTLKTVVPGVRTYSGIDDHSPSLDAQKEKALEQTLMVATQSVMMEIINDCGLPEEVVDRILRAFEQIESFEFLQQNIISHLGPFLWDEKNFVEDGVFNIEKFVKLSRNIYTALHGLAIMKFDNPAVEVSEQITHPKHNIVFAYPSFFEATDDSDLSETHIDTYFDRYCNFGIQSEREGDSTARSAESLFPENDEPLEQLKEKPYQPKITPLQEDPTQTTTIKFLVNGIDVVAMSNSPVNLAVLLKAL